MMNVHFTKLGCKTLAVLALTILCKPAAATDFKVGKWYKLFSMNRDLDNQIIETNALGTAVGHHGEVLSKGTCVKVLPDILSKDCQKDYKGKDYIVLYTNGKQRVVNSADLKSCCWESDGHYPTLDKCEKTERHAEETKKYCEENAGFGANFDDRNKYWKECDAFVKHLEALNIRKGEKVDFSDSYDTSSLLSGPGEIQTIKDVTVIKNKKSDNVKIECTFVKLTGSDMDSYDCYKRDQVIVTKKITVNKSDLKPHEDTRLTIGDWVKAEKGSGKYNWVSTEFSPGYIGQIVGLEFSDKKHTMKYKIEWTHDLIDVTNDRPEGTMNPRDKSKRSTVGVSLKKLYKLKKISKDKIWELENGIRLVDQAAKEANENGKKEKEHRRLLTRPRLQSLLNAFKEAEHNA